MPTAFSTRRPSLRSSAFGLLLLASCGGSGSGVSQELMYEVTRGEFTVHVRERGELRAASNEKITSQLEGRNTIIFLIQEGTLVEKGDKLVELDAAEIVEKHSSESIVVARAKAGVEQGRKNFEIMEKVLAASESTAESKLRIARMRLEKLIGQPRKVALSTGNGPSGSNAEALQNLRNLLSQEEENYPKNAAQYAGLTESAYALLGEPANLQLQMGDIANQILKQINDVKLSRADLELTADTLYFSRKLNEKGFLTKNELDRDELSYQRQLSQMTLAWNNLNLLIHYSLPETIIETQQNSANAELELESERAGAEARRVREAVDLESAEAEYEFARGRLDNWADQIDQAIMLAPSTGLVVYGREDWDEPVYEGMEVRKRQELVILPDVTRMVAELKVHEAQIDRVAIDQMVTIKVDAFPDKSFVARVTEVASLPSQNWRTQAKQYEVLVELERDNSDGVLRPGMNASVEILVGTMLDVVNVPITCIDRKDEQHYAWVEGPGGPRPQKVKLGTSNLTHVEVLEGLEGGEVIYMVRPEGESLPDAQDAVLAVE